MKAKEIENQIESEIQHAAPSIKIKDIGPIKELTIPVPAEGGVVVLRGRNGAGKSKALEATQALLRGSGSLETRDGQKAGSLEAFGAKITVGRSTRRTGELDCRNLEGKLDITALVDPGMKDQAANDARRIKALISLTGIKADKNLFLPLVGNAEDFEAVVSKSSLETEDLVEMAGKIKRDLEAEARKAEDMAEKEKGHAQSSLEAIQGIDLTAESDSTKLHATLVAAIEKNSALKALAESAQQGIAAAADAQGALEKAIADYQGPSIQDSTTELSEADANVSEAKDHFDRVSAVLQKVQEDYRDAKQAVENAAIKRTNAAKAMETAKQHEAAMAAWKAQVEQGNAIKEIPHEELAAASRAVDEAQEASNKGATIRAALERRASAEEHAKQASRYARYANRLREAARSTDEVLSQAVASDTLRVEAGRLVLDTDRGVTYFSDLSQGQKWKLALKIASERAGKTGVIIAKEPAWVSIDPANQQFVNDTAKALGVVLLVEQPSEGALRAELYGE